MKLATLLEFGWGGGGLSKTTKISVSVVGSPAEFRKKYLIYRIQVRRIRA
jgi:hypothetical protein